MALLEPNNIYALLVGISNYRDNTGFHKLPAAVNNVEVLKKSFTKNIGISESNIRVVKDCNSTDDIKSALGDLKRNKKANDILLFYYAGHGLLANDLKRYFITTCLSQNNANEADISSLDIDSVFQILFSSGSKSIVVLDSCFSEAAFNSIDSRNDVYAMASAAFNKEAIYKENANHSEFTAHLLEILEKGIDYSNTDYKNDLKKIVNLTPRMIFDEVRGRLVASGCPPPKDTNRNSLGDILLTKNRYQDSSDAQHTRAIYANEIETLYEKMVDTDDTILDDVNPDKLPLDYSAQAGLIKSKLIDYFPRDISHYLSKFLVPDRDREDFQFYREFYEHIVMLLSFVAIKIITDDERINLDLLDIKEEQLREMKPEEAEKLKLDIETCRQLRRKVSECIDQGIFNPTHEWYLTTLKNIVRTEDFKRQLILYFRDMGFVDVISAINENDTDAPEFRKMLFRLVVELTPFWINHKIMSVTFIRVRREYFQPKKFLHLVSDLTGPRDSSSKSLTFINDCIHNGVILTQKKERSEALIKLNDPYVNLWPFVIDSNINRNLRAGDNNLPVIHIYKEGSQGNPDFIYTSFPDKGNDGAYSKLMGIIGSSMKDEMRENFSYFIKRLSLHGQLTH